MLYALLCPALSSKVEQGVRLSDPQASTALQNQRAVRETAQLQYCFGGWNSQALYTYTYTCAISCACGVHRSHRKQWHFLSVETTLVWNSYPAAFFCDILWSARTKGAVEASHRGLSTLTGLHSCGCRTPRHEKHGAKDNRLDNYYPNDHTKKQSLESQSLGQSHRTSSSQYYQNKRKTSESKYRR